MKKILFFILLPFVGQSQIAMNVSGSYTQDFNTLASAGTSIAWTDNSTINNWYCQKSTAGAITYDASIGNSGTGKVYSFGSLADPDRALGTIGSGTIGNVAHGVQLQNTSLGTINSISLSYSLEQWRDAGNAVPAAQDIRVYYKISNAAITSLNPNVNATWIEITGLLTSSPINTTTAGALDGNLIPNRVVSSSITIPGLILASGEFIMIKWEDPNHAGTDHGLSIDDVTINWVVSCATTNSFSIVSCNNYTVPSGDETYTTSGIYLDTIPNSALCDSLLTIDVTIVTGITYFADTDTDGLGDLNNTTIGCSLPVGYVTNSDDCNDSNNAIGIATTTFYQDFDSDSFGSALVTIIACSAPIGFVSNNLDCDDASSGINPSAFDILDNGIDEDCSGSDASSLGTEIGLYEFTSVAICPVTSIAVTSQPTNAVFSDYSSTGTSCSAAGNVFSNSGWNTTSSIDLNEYNEFSVVANDCYSLDLNRIIFTHKTSATGGTPTWVLRSNLDNFSADLGTGTSSSVDKTDTINLNSSFDAISQITFRFYLTSIGTNGATWRNDNVRVIGNFGTLTSQTYYADLDSDAFGDPFNSIIACTPPVGYIIDNTDCDDTDGLINPNTVWFQDADLDNVGTPNNTVVSCTQPVGYVSISGDCDDTNPLIIGPTTYYLDTDNDGHGAIIGLAITSCTNPGIGYVTISDDCDDNQNTVYPGAPELCDGLDNNCLNGVDDGLVYVNYYTDADADTYGTGAAQSLCSDPGIGYALVAGDCDDTNPNAYPGALEILNNGVDENCDATDNYAGLLLEEYIQFEISPNPTTGMVSLISPSVINGTLICNDLQGNVLFLQKLSENEVLFDFSFLANGTYFLRIETENSFTQKRFVIQK